MTLEDFKVEVMISIFNKKSIWGFHKVLEWFTYAETHDNIANVMNDFKKAFDQDTKLYRIEGIELKELLKFTIERSKLKFTKLPKDIQKTFTRYNLDFNKNNNSFNHNIYGKQKKQFTRNETKKVLLVLEQLILTAKKDRLKNDFVHIIKKLKELVALELSELKWLINHIVIWTNGTCPIDDGSNPGGWGYILFLPKEKKKHYDNGSFTMTNNNQIGLYAVIQGIEMALKLDHTDILVYSDSNYVVDVCNESMYSLASNNWLTSNNKQPDFIDSIQRLYDLITDSGNSIRIEWIDPASGIHLNKQVIKLAMKAVRKRNASLVKLEIENPKHLDFQSYRYLKRKLFNK